MRTWIFTFVILLTAAAGPCPAQADQALSFVINPHTGAASIRNDTNSAVSIDGYLLTSSQSVFNPASWSTLTTNPSFPGWAQGPAAPNRLGEANLLSSLALNGGTSLSLGSPYLPFTPTAIGQVEPGLKFEYSIAGIGSIEGDVVFAPQNNVVLLVNPATGAASLQNQSLFPVNIDGLLITSPAGVLDPIGWQGLAESGAAGWTTGAAATNRLGEGNLLSSTFLAAGGAPVPIGAPINPAMITDETELFFEYHIAGGGSVSGGVAFLVAAAPPIVGDYNSNGTVDAADYSIWRDTLGSTTDLRANGNNSGASAGKIDAADYQAWKTNFGATAGAGGGAAALAAAGAAVPEPSAGVIGCLGALVFSVGRFARRTGGARGSQSNVPNTP